MFLEEQTKLLKSLVNLNLWLLENYLEALDFFSMLYIIEQNMPEISPKLSVNLVALLWYI